MGGILSKPKASDTSAQEARLAAQDASIAAQEAETKKKEAAQRRARSIRASGAASLISGSELGVENGTRKTLG